MAPRNCVLRLDLDVGSVYSSTLYDVATRRTYCQIRGSIVLMRAQMALVQVKPYSTAPRISLEIDIKQVRPLLRFSTGFKVGTPEWRPTAALWALHSATHWVGWDASCPVFNGEPHRLPFTIGFYLFINSRRISLPLGSLPTPCNPWLNLSWGQISLGHNRILVTRPVGS